MNSPLAQERHFSYQDLSDHDFSDTHSANNLNGDQESITIQHFQSPSDSDWSYQKEIEADINEASCNNNQNLHKVKCKRFSFLDKGAFTALFQNEKLFLEKSETLKALAAEVQDIDSMSHQEKEMVIDFFQKIPKSNIYKNIYRCFNRFVLKSNNQVTLECLDISNKNITVIRKQYSKFLKPISFSEMVHRIMKNERYSVFFKYYLKVHFLDDLCQGNFKQLKEHYVSSIFFLMCFSDPTYMDQIKFCKK